MIYNKIIGKWSILWLQTNFFQVVPKFIYGLKIKYFCYQFTYNVVTWSEVFINLG